MILEGQRQESKRIQDVSLLLHKAQEQYDKDSMKVSRIQPTSRLDTQTSRQLSSSLQGSEVEYIFGDMSV